MRDRRNRVENTQSWVDRAMNSVISTQSKVVPAHPFEFIRSRFAPLRNAPKVVACLADASPRSAEKWLRGENDPSARALLEIARKDPDVQQALINWLRDAS